MVFCNVIHKFPEISRRKAIVFQREPADTGFMEYLYRRHPPPPFSLPSPSPLSPLPSASITPLSHPPWSSQEGYNDTQKNACAGATKERKRLSEERMSRNHVAAMMSVNGSLCLCSDPSRMLEVTDSLRQVLVVHVAEVDRSAEVQMMEVEVQTSSLSTGAC